MIGYFNQRGSCDIYIDDLVVDDSDWIGVTEVCRI